ncbi:hypothetical protein G6O69_38270 [Pseudenhygromyxa sp. WMMC2535]|uniref:hypothetical protein n=1 Tax=Pseudenhygromyxa sp. WMMC2535 TaxID=2712867 RepID=UPI00159543DE|nr:hypothetical protein [Pseudenhygromyxa sp. WMMC2535]NVB43712.1 hypothetical protein [Pseudenhygromyxa sp. WMMC2535]
MRSKSIVFLLLTALVWAPACKKNQEEETTKPEDDTWVPDESLEPEPAPQPVEPELSEEERLEKAKGYYVEAEGKAAEGDWEGRSGSTSRPISSSLASTVSRSRSAGGGAGR